MRRLDGRRGFTRTLQAQLRDLEENGTTFGYEHAQDERKEIVSVPDIKAETPGGLLKANNSKGIPGILGRIRSRSGR